MNVTRSQLFNLTTAWGYAYKIIAILFYRDYFASTKLDQLFTASVLLFFNIVIMIFFPVIRGFFFQNYQYIFKNDLVYFSSTLYTYISRI